MVKAIGEMGWVIARVPSNREFKVFEAIERPTIGFEWVEGQKKPIYGKGPACYAPVEIRLARKNQYTAKKREGRTERAFPLFSGYLFIQDPKRALIEGMKERGLIYGLIPDVPRASNGYAPGPLRLSQRAIDHMRARYGCQYDLDTGAGHYTSSKPEAHMQPGHEYEAGDYVIADDPAFFGHRLLCLEVLDTKARVICRMFGIDHEVTVGLGDVRKAG